MVEIFDAQPNNPTSITINWDISNNSIIDNYTVSYRRLCDNVEGSVFIGGSSTTETISGLSSGLLYTVSIIPVNILGKGMERTNNVTVQKDGKSHY